MDEKIPTFSVVVTAYKHGNYIKSTVESVLKQTFQDFEIIVIDDGSPDDTKEKVLSIKDERVNYVWQEPSGLPAYSRNKGILLSKGRYIAFLDGDDLWYPHKLESCYKILEENQDVTLVCHDEAVRYQGKIIDYTKRKPSNKDLYMELLLRGNFLSSSAVVVKRNIFLNKDNLFSERKDFFTAEDYDLWIRLAKKFKINLIAEVLGEYNLFDENTITNNIERNAYNMLNVLDFHLAKFDNKLNKRFSVKIAIARRKAAILCGAARTFHRQKNFTKSKLWYRKSLQMFPFYHKPLIGMFASILNIKV